MFTQILVPTDGSKLSDKAIRTAVRLAKASGARVSGAYVIPPYVPPRGEAAIYIAGLSAQRYKTATQEEARKALAAIQVEAGIAQHAAAVGRAELRGGEAEDEEGELLHEFLTTCRTGHIAPGRRRCRGARRARSR